MSIDNDINAIAGVHLGKAGDGSAVKPYITPDTVDSTLLVAVPRVLNRTIYDIHDDDLPFEGYDTWNAYEFSTLTTNGFPVTGTLRIVYPSHTPNIVESKSLKLYLNSFNMMRVADTIEDTIDTIELRIIQDLCACIGDSGVEVGLVREEYSTELSPFNYDFVAIDSIIDPTTIDFSHYNESPDILVVEDDNGRYAHRYRSNVLRSNCRVTNQPDFGDVYIHFKGSKRVTVESLLQYIVSMRKENHFHEEICECIYKRLYDLLEPEELFVACLYSRRGGIDINPVRASSSDLHWKISHNLTNAYTTNRKTMKQ